MSQGALRLCQLAWSPSVLAVPEPRDIYMACPHKNFFVGSAVEGPPFNTFWLSPRLVEGPLSKYELIWSLDRPQCFLLTAVKM